MNASVVSAINTLIDICKAFDASGQKTFSGMPLSVVMVNDFRLFAGKLATYHSNSNVLLSDITEVAWDAWKTPLSTLQSLYSFGSALIDFPESFSRMIEYDNKQIQDNRSGKAASLWLAVCIYVGQKMLLNNPSEPYGELAAYYEYLAGRIQHYQKQGTSADIGAAFEWLK